MLDSVKLLYVTDGKRHLICIPYTVDNLHLMAKRLGISKSWFHSGTYPHYDIPKRRISELESKCKMISSKELLQIIKDTK